MSTPMDAIAADQARLRSTAQAGLDRVTATETAIPEQKAKELAPLEAQQHQTFEDARAMQPPAPAQLPETPNKPLVDPKEYEKLSWGLIGMALIGGVASRGNWYGASASLNGAMKGYLEGNQARADEDWRKYQADFDKAVKAHDDRQKDYLDTLNNKKLTLNQIATEISAKAAKYDDQYMRAEAQRKSYDGMLARADNMDVQREKIKNDHEKVKLAIDRFGRDSKGSLTSGAVQELAEQAEAGDTSALVGLSKVDKEAVRNRMADNAQIRGTTGADQAARNANFAGIKAGERTLGTRQANIDSAVTEAQKVLPILRAASDAVPRSKITSLNQLIQVAERGTSDAALLRFAQAARSFANIYTRAVVPGASGVTDREESIKNLPTFTDQKSFNGVLDIMEQEMAAAKASPAAVREDMARDITGRKPGQDAEVPRTPVKAPAVGTIEDGHRFKGGDPSKPESWEVVSGR